MSDQISEFLKRRAEVIERIETEILGEPQPPTSDPVERLWISEVMRGVYLAAERGFDAGYAMQVQERNHP